MKLAAADGTEFPLNSPVVTIGRDPENDIQLRDSRVSRRHALIRFEGGAPTIEDLGSTNWTLVNGQRVRSPRRLKDGDWITFASTTLVFQQGSGPLLPDEPDPDHLAALVAGLEGSGEAQQEAAVQLVAVGPPAVPALAAALESAGPRSRWAAAWVLGEIGDRRAAAPLIALLESALDQEDGDDLFPRVAAEALGKLGDRRAAGVLHAALASPSEAVREAAEAALDQLRRSGEPATTQALDHLIAGLELTGEDQEQAAALLIEIGPPAVPALAAALQRVESRAAWAAAWVLGEIGAEQAVEPLIGALTAAGATAEPSALLRAAAAGALGRIGGQHPDAVAPALPALEAACADPSEVVREAARAALESIQRSAGTAGC